MTVEIKMGEDPRKDVVGTLNYPSLPHRAGGLILTQYASAGSICGATPIGVQISAPNDHPLSALKPVSLTWAAYSPNLTFSGIPQIPLPTSD